MNNGIFSQDIYGKVGFDAGLPRPLLGAPGVCPMPYYYPGGDWKIDMNNLVYVIDTRSYSTPAACARIPAGTATIDWGDGIIENRSGPFPIHNYASHGIYIIQVYNVSNLEFGIGTQAFTVDPYRQNVIKCLSFGNKITNLRAAFSNCSNLIQVPTYMGSHVTRVYNMFNNCSLFDQNLSAYDFTGLSDDGIGKGFQGMFSGCNRFNNGGVSLNSWNTSRSTSMFQMFANAGSFNQDIGAWDTSNMTDMSSAFTYSAFNNGGSSSISNWNTSNVTNMSNMFLGNTVFNQDISSWNTANVTNMSFMFNGNRAFNQPIGIWNTSNVTNMSQMFANCVFNQNIGLWNVNKVINFNSMFFANFSFNNGGSSDINNWNINTSGSIDMTRMFYDNKPFNQPLGSWNVSKVTSMSQMFPYAAFDHDISTWNIASVTTLYQMRAFGGGFSTANYNALLIGWNNNKLVGANGVANWNTTLGPNFGTSKYTAGGSAATARASLVTYGWTITDGGSV